ncbi:HalOD1 output domain-containing protein [Halomarina halobia]|uniref:HalOD1 output domain-containing protein n=1 Tax=Halomarina halobia TaxID=3033386 RepID=A0ABD6A9E1_9EURY|nr:HalOD1 output domain-containing protein [Halomarina sp. PSR21]
MPSTDDPPDPLPAVYTASYDPGETPPSVALVLAVAEVEGVDPLELNDSLYASVDPECLDGLLRPRFDGTLRLDGHVSFRCCGYHVTVAGDGSITVSSAGCGCPE